MTDNESILSGWGVYFFCIRIEQELACSIMATRKLPVADPVGSDI